MKHFTKILLGFCLFSTQLLYAQRYVEVPLNASDPTDLVAFIDEDQAGAGAGTNTIYQLENGGIYLVRTNWQPTYDLHIEAKDLENTLLKPLITRVPNADLSYSGRIWAEGNLTLRNVHYIMGERGPGERYQGAQIRMRTENTRLILTDCILDKDRLAFTRLVAPGIKAYVTNTVYRNGIQDRSFGGNGRLFDARDFTVDSLVVRNSVLHNSADRIFRSLGAIDVHNYIEFDHVTVFNQIGRFGGFQFGYGANTIKVTNSIFRNPVMLGTWAGGDPAGAGNEQTQEEAIREVDPDISKKLFTINTGSDTIATDVTFANNNIFYTSDVLDFYASNDTVSQIGIYSDALLAAMGSTDPATTYFTEVLEFNSVPAPALQHVKDIWADPASTELFSLVVEPSDRAGTDYDPGANGTVFDFGTFDVRYSEGTTSAKADFDGNAIGADIDFTGTTNPGALSVVDGFVESFFIYPNPVEGPATFRYELQSPSEVSVTILDLNGKELGTIDSGRKSSGQHEISVDLGQYINNYGIYFAKFSSAESNRVMRLVYMKK